MDAHAQRLAHAGALLRLLHARDAATYASGIRSVAWDAASESIEVLTASAAASASAEAHVRRVAEGAGLAAPSLTVGVEAPPRSSVERMWRTMRDAI